MISLNQSLILQRYLYENPKMLMPVMIYVKEGVYEPFILPLIIRIEASSNYTTIYSLEENKEKTVLTKCLGEFESLLPDIFMRVHESHTINLLLLCRYYPRPRVIMMPGGVEVSIAKSRLKKFQGKYEFWFGKLDDHQKQKKKNSAALIRSRNLQGKRRSHLIEKKKKIMEKSDCNF